MGGGGGGGCKVDGRCIRLKRKHLEKELIGIHTSPPLKLHLHFRSPWTGRSVFSLQDVAGLVKRNPYE